MSEKTAQDNKVLVDFWSEVLDLSEEDREELGKCSAEDWKELAPSEKLFAAAASLGSRKKRSPGYGHRGRVFRDKEHATASDGTGNSPQES